MIMQESGEMYLETIYRLSQSLPVVRSIDVSEYIGYSKPSVSRAIGILKKQEYITVDKLGAITLTDKGRERAQYIFERHKCLTKIFTLLGVNAETAAEDACKAEHILSEQTLEKIREYALLHDAESTLTEFLRLRALKRTRHGGEVILADWLEVWLRDFICPNREKTTVHGYENIIRLHLVPALGEVKLPELQPAQLQRYYAELLEKGLSHNTVRKHHVLLHTALEAAVRQGLLRENVTRYVTPPAKVLPSHRYYDPAQLRELFCRCAGTEIEPAVKLAGYLGLRRSEICGLKWRCVDLDAKIVTVREVRTSVGGTFIEKKPKSYSSVRRLCYDGVSDLEKLLTRLHDEWERGQRERGTGFNPEGYVAVTEQGKPWDPNGLGRRVAAFVEENALPSISLHGLRHSFASVANSRSVPMFTISKALGHSSTSITSEVYTHLFDETVQDVVNVVAKAIGTRA